MKLSASKVDTFLGCRRLFRYRYVSMPFTPEENKHFAVGNVAHHTLELFHDTSPGLPKDRMRQAYVAAHAKQTKKNSVLTHKDYIDIRNMMKSYLDVFGNDTPNILFKETYFSVTVGDVCINGRADRVDLVDDSVVIVDYKTNSKPMPLKDAYESVQLPTYALWLSRLGNLPSSMVGRYVFLKHLGKKNGTLDIRITDDMMDAATDKYNRVHSELSGNVKFKRNTAYKYCMFCDFRAHCFNDKED